VQQNKHPLHRERREKVGLLSFISLDFELMDSFWYY
jgi:hypothetical protein